MKRISAFAAATFLMTVACSTSAFAQINDRCQRQVDELCGGEPMSACMMRPGMMEQVSAKCVGQVQTMIEIEGEVARDQSPNDDYVPTKPDDDYVATKPDDTITGISYGGVLRSGPGIEYSKVASMQEGDPVDIIQDTGVWYEGYKWYKVRTHRGGGYHWGGIFCVSLDTQIEGIFQKCNDR